MINSTYCDLKPLNSYFNNKPLYKCDYCGLTVGLENPDTQILCFKKMETLTSTIHKTHTNQVNNDIFHLEENESLADNLLKKIQADQKNTQQQQQIEDTNNLCSEEQIQQRLAICNTCEYYKNDSCLLCGCTVVREANYKNKLAHKDQKCPAGKWDIVTN